MNQTTNQLALHHTSVPVALPAIGARGEYFLPEFRAKNGEVVAGEIRVAVEVIGHIGTFGLRLRETMRLRMEIETHFTSFVPETYEAFCDRKGITIEKNDAHRSDYYGDFIASPKT